MVFVEVSISAEFMTIVTEERRVSVTLRYEHGESQDPGDRNSLQIHIL